MLKPVVHRLRIYWSLWKFLVVTACSGLLTVVCFTFGWRLTTPAWPLAFARSGALATAIAILFTLYNFAKRVGESEQSARQFFERLTSGLTLTGEASLKKIENKLRENTQRVTRVAIILQAIILFVATLVWGFGDLATQCIKGTPNSPTTQACSLFHKR